MSRIHAIMSVLLTLVTVVAGNLGLGTATPVASPVTDGTFWWQGSTCYEIFVRSFADSDGDGNGDLQGVISKLDYLNDGQPGTGNDLGVTCIWLMPVMESPSYHGYDVTDYYTVEADYGTNDDFKQLMTEAHRRGIHVIIDFPINHTSIDHPWFQDAITGPDAKYRDWYIFEPTNPGYRGPWGEEVWHQTPGATDFYYGVFWSGMPDLNLRNPDVNAEIRKIIDFWLLEMGADGFRMDAIKHAIEDGKVQEGTPETIQWIRDFDDYVHQVKPEAFTVGEVMGSSTDSLQAYYPDTLDSYFHFTMAQNMVNSANFGQARTLMPVVAGAEERLPDQRWAIFLTNHDQERVATQIGSDWGELRVAGMLLFTLPGTPFIYYGEEIGMTGAKPDEQIRTPMQWSAEPNGGFTTGAPWEGLQPGWETTNVAFQEQDPASPLALYRQWGGIREVHPALQTGAYIPLETPNKKVMAFLRVSDEETVLVVINLAKAESEDLTLAIPDGVDGSTMDLLTGQAGPTIDGGVIHVGVLPAQSGTLLQVGD